MKQAQYDTVIATTCGLVARFMAGHHCSMVRPGDFDRSVEAGGYCLDAPDWSPAGSTVWVPAGHATSSLSSIRGE